MPKTTKPVKTVKSPLPPEIFNSKVNPLLMAQAVRVYLSNQRKAQAKTKTRGEVTGSGRKIYQQKGTGRARHGDKYAPIFVGGGVAFGPTGKENYKLTMSKKMKKAALFSALTSQEKEGNVLVADLSKISPKTKEMSALLKEKLKATGKILLVLPRDAKDAARAAKNIKALTITLPGDLNTYQVLNHNKIVFAEKSLPELAKVFLEEKEKKD